MQSKEKPARVIQGSHGDSTEGFLLNNLYCSECTQKVYYIWLKLFIAGVDLMTIGLFNQVIVTYTSIIGSSADLLSPGL